MTTSEVQDRIFNIGNNATLRVVKNDGANTIDTDLKRIALDLESSVRAFAKVVTRLNIFATAFNNVPLEGTNEFSVPFYPLETAASTNFNGTYAFGDSNTQAVTLTIDRRKYQSLSFTSAEARRQPAFNPAQLMALKAEKLGVDIWLDVLSLVTSTNFPNVGKTLAPASYDSDTIADIRAAANALQWGQEGRSLVVNSDCDLALLKDDSFKIAFAYGDSTPIQEGKIPRIAGFAYQTNPNIPSNSEHLVGLAAVKAAIAVGFSPIRPTEEVSTLASYAIVTDKATGVSLEVRKWGNADADSSRMTVEANYGIKVLNPAALLRLVSE